MKTEFLFHYRRAHGLRAKDRLLAFLPRYAPLASRFGWLLGLRDRVPALAALGERLFGVSARRSLPRFSPRPFHRSRAARAEDNPHAATSAGDRGAARGGGSVASGTGGAPAASTEASEVVLLVDTFNDYFEPENAHAAKQVLEAAGYRVHVARPPDGGRPLCCGRTFLAAGLVEQARVEARRLLDAVLPFVHRGVPVVGLEPSCLLTLRDEFLALRLGPDAQAVAPMALLFEEFLAREQAAGRLKLALRAVGAERALLHGHCHQKAFDALRPVEQVLKLIPELEVTTVASSCCGMAGAFGYEAMHYDVSMRMAEAALLPAVRDADAGTLIVADGTSCRHQIADGAAREALHVARVLQMALPQAH